MSDALLARALEHLERLVAFDTRNPPRRVDAGGLFGYVVASLPPGFSVEVRDHGAGCVSLFARRGAPTRLYNVHVDTVPADPAWSGDPFRLEVAGDRAAGLGACDVKGAAACLLAALPETRGDAALLFSSDEEAGQDVCVRAFLREHAGFEEVIVAEPTRCEAVLAHRGVAAATGIFSGRGGHASASRALADSAVHEAVRWAGRALALAERAEAEHASLLFNLGVVEGGVKSNMIAATAKVRFGIRPPPDIDPAEAVARFRDLAPDAARVEWQDPFLVPPLPAPAAGRSFPEAEGAARELAARLGLPVGAPVDFWTEASLFSEAGATALVFGPGDIAQAHAPGEWVALAELSSAAATYRRLFS